MTASGERSVTISIGVAIDSPANSVDAIINAADAVLFRAKNKGRNCILTKKRS